MLIVHFIRKIVLGDFLIKNLIQEKERRTKMKKIVFFFIVVIAIVFIQLVQVSAFELRPYFEVGSQVMDEPGDKGSRSNIGIGIQPFFQKDNLDYWLDLRLWTTFEPADEKISAPTGAKHLSIGGRYRLFEFGNYSLSPFLTIGWESWKRNLENCSTFINRFTDIQFASTNFGVRIQRGKFFLDAGANYPFWNSTDNDNLSGQFGYNGFLGYEAKWAIIGVYGDSYRFRGGRFQPDFNFYRVGLRMIFKIHF
ncbi:MAG: hypothetical protein ABH830_02495 [Patescibacteria group bacterium]